ncbi:hypothetical protein [Streptomyces sp. NPDC048603]|uniref:hypothetical protein n=1 Tax=Streptomyces sp. NPDC048603 TaxID=3365577 RepID=UPI003720FE1A
MRAAASHCSGPGRPWHVLTDHQEWSAPPLPLPTAPGAWHQLAAAGGWQVVVADTAHPITHDLVAARAFGTPALTAEWCSLPMSVPVLAAPATGSGVAALQRAIRAIVAEGLPLRRMVVALVQLGGGRPPAVVRAAAAMLQPQVSAVVHVPFDDRIHTHGLADGHRITARKTREAGEEIARAVLASARHTWGEPLPAAAVPAPARGPAPPVAPVALSLRPAPAEEEVPA